MIQMRDFIKKNDKENFKYCCSEMSQILETHTEKLKSLRQTFYNCIQQQCKKLQDSQLQNDIILINELISVIKSRKQKNVFSGTVMCLIQYKEQFTQIDEVIQNELKIMSITQMRKFSTNMKMYDNVIEKRNHLYNYYNSFDDLDSPVKIKEEVFTF
ncbi:hypothetical protein TTHERM_00138140 (macronuclear) [Tetrahymena thermophila SB210]|uniref:Uncharacterized protein n=1 Tax=Tetrahymena thermophila (strain SB210) TaxID=312017 RepID=I7M290_TETTS|nr:hypothetical protein TTHERM_00138140 [Tetrahymena thermophila SB210]EAR99551.2 hypothetical protein TTHERM_00138140 [Tetrahymena thermophila SB210]|eukprot:XP_001019796.2 hypothetical protein TTHERM_00138140 [Tetrahymena thermophila SB210]